MDDEQFKMCIDEMHSKVYRVAYSYVRSFADAEDITQEAFLRLYCCKKSFRSDGDMHAWLIRTTINLSINLLRSGWRKRRAELPDEGLDGVFVPLPDDKSRDLTELLKLLTPEQMTAVYLHYYEGYQVKEIAKMCGTTSATISMRLSRARARLKMMLTAEEGIYE